MFLRLMLSAFILTYGTMLPIYWSFKAIKENSFNELKRWLTYWMTLAMVTTVVGFIDACPFLWIPFYYETVFITVGVLACPYCNASSALYDYCLQPFLERHEERLDDWLAALWMSSAQLVKDITKNIVKVIVIRFEEHLNSRGRISPFIIEVKKWLGKAVESADEPNTKAEGDTTRDDIGEANLSNRVHPGPHQFCRQSNVYEKVMTCSKKRKFHK